MGVLLVGNAFTSNAFVDSIKAATEKGMTIFEGDTRISTTIIINGQRAVRTKLNNPNVEDEVLKGGKVYDAEATILGKNYKTVYWPLRNSAGDILGM